MSILRNRPVISCGLALAVLTLLNPTHLLAQASIADASIVSDSIMLVIDTDTLTFKSLYAIEYPAYTPEQDSLVTQKLVSDDRQYGNSAESGLAATGSISRGIQVSSNASVSLQSSMYLKIKGTLSDNYTVSGVLTEKTSPLQPIGNTRRLNDFDRVLVTIDGPAMTASIGDIDLRLNQGRFGKLERSIEGLDLQSRSNTASVNASLGFSYGKYHLQQLQGKDGKQGPYRLSGKNGEKFIIILAGSEKVRLDGHLLQRGAKDDYIFDYNAAEVTFTQKRILSSNARISIEFEYVPDIYLSSYSFGKKLVVGGFTYGSADKAPFHLSATWQELADDQNNPLGNIENDVLKGIFDNLADTVQTTWISGISPDTVNGNYNINQNGFLEYAGIGQGAFIADFTFVGINQGEYRKELGAVENYFVHDTLQGEYLPAQRFFAPQSQSVLAINANASLGFIKLDLDLGLSKRVNNLYARQENSLNRKAWDLKLGTQGRGLDLLIGDKYYESGFSTHDVLESTEYYRRWQIAPRIIEEEALRYAHLQLGQRANNYFRGEAARFSRSGVIVGEQARLEGQVGKNAPIGLSVNSYVTEIGSTINQQHTIQSALKIFNKLSFKLDLDVEDMLNSQVYASNNHLSTGAGLFYDWSASHGLSIQYNNRKDYRIAESLGSFLKSTNLDHWTDQRQDVATEYNFSDFLNTSGKIQFKYREHLNDSSSTTTYYLGNFDFKSKALNDRLRYQGTYVIDEEHIPKYDFHYILVDTGYGDYSYDPHIKDYIPISGGRFVRQRVFSDLEEQVRKHENKTRLEFTTLSYAKAAKAGIKTQVRSESRSKLQIGTGDALQDQQLNRLDISIRTGHDYLVNELKYSGKITENNSTLYNYGAENSHFNTHEGYGNLIWGSRNRLKLGLLYEERERDVEYNPLAHERWTSYRPYARHIYTISPKQKYTLELKYSEISDLVLDQVYQESYITINHDLRFSRRGRIDQKVLFTRIQADVSGIPYSMFSGRQPGDNWKYTVNGRYTFSSRFQISINYSLEERGTNRTEQFLRVEGRTHF